VSGASLGTDCRVFITHSSLDKELAEALVNYLRLATGLSPAQVFCSSVEGYGVPTGASFMNFIRVQLQKTRLVVPLITPAYLDSVFCQWELGAVWARRGLPSFPIRVSSVDHSRLPAPLAQLQISEISHQGLRGLARDVANVFGVRVFEDVAASAADDLLGRYQDILQRLEPGWATTDQAKLRRSARHATASKHLHNALHRERDASFLMVLEKSITPRLANQFVEELREVTKELAGYFSEVTGTQCRITLKQVLAEADDSYYVQDIARNHGRLRTARDPIVGNTDFERILRADDNYFWSNDLVKEVATGYLNSHGVPGAGLSYRSTIVWPIRKRLSSHDVAAQIGSPLPDHDLLGFLCVDAAVPGAFDDADFEIGAGVADSLYPILLPYLAPHRRDGHGNELAIAVAEKA
jgi:hypothetical protein